MGGIPHVVDHHQAGSLLELLTELKGGVIDAGKAGPFTGQVTVASNDPKSPTQVLLLKGVGKASPLAPAEPSGPNLQKDSGCGCRMGEWETS